MHDRGFKRWGVLGALASAAWLVSACESAQHPGNESFSPGFVRNPVQVGYNGTIKDIPTSIDPRTPQAEGTPGRSLPFDLGERALIEQRRQQGMGGSGAAYEAQGPESTMIAPANDEPAARSLPGENLEPADATQKPREPLRR
ncbi:hypothetical protein JQX13_07005 [Archangium violaceum]|uniref:hypothetical protein n=1 Tax=Archangium violaceum TaxID=83451 RepID=UPI00193B461D|nr:hypothetical protein [Archangium violaceum]QRK09851.1 hypothetical protein JQX13_07005 [Archangium violaceum]